MKKTSDLIDKIKKAKVSSTIGDSSKRTNAFSSNSWNKIAEAISEIKKAMLAKSQLPKLRENPKKSDYLPSVEQRFSNLAKDVGVDEHKLQFIFKNLKSTGNPLVIDALKKLIMAVKISGDIDFEPLNKKMRDARETYETIFDQTQKSNDAVLKASKKHDKMISEKEKVYQTEWRGLLIDLIGKVNINPKLVSLGSLDQWLVKALINEKVASLIDDKVTIDWNEAVKIPFMRAEAICRKAIEKQKEYNFNQWHDNLEKAPDSKLCEYLEELPNLESGYLNIFLNECETRIEKKMIQSRGFLNLKFHGSFLDLINKLRNEISDEFEIACIYVNIIENF